MWWIVWLAVSLAVPQQAAPAPVAAASTARPSAGSKNWIGRYEEFEAFLLSAPIERQEDVGSGVTRPRHAFFAPGGLAAGAVVKNLQPGKRDGYWESYRSEIAAYKLDRLLQLDMVPPTVERRVDKILMSAQLWVENTRTLKKLQADKDSAPDTNAWNRQVYRQRVFDDLVANIDENSGNLLIDPAWNIIKVDHSRAFAQGAKMPFPLTKIDRDLFDRLKALDDAAIRREVGPFLEGDMLASLLSRRKEIVATFNKLAKEKGEAQVFVP